MFDPRLQSVHLESPPRREEFRRMRGYVENAIGERTLVGDVALPLAHEDGDQTLPSISPDTEAPGSLCWLVYKGKQMPLHVGLNSLGRLPDNDIILEDDTVSRRHCAIVVHSNLRVELYDIASKNGTKINGHKVNGPSDLLDGDEINICGCRMRFVLGTPTANLSSIKLHLSDDYTFVG